MQKIRQFVTKKQGADVFTSNMLTQKKQRTNIETRNNKI